MIYDGVEKGIMQDGPSHQQAQTQDHCMSMYIYIYCWYRFRWFDKRVENRVQINLNLV